VYNENVRFLGKVAIIFSDLTAISLSVLLAYYTRQEIFRSFFDSLGIKRLEPFSFYLPLLALILIFWLVVGAATRIFNDNTFWEDVRRIWENSFLVVITVLSFSFIVKKEQLLSRVILLLGFFFSLFLVPAFRLLVRKILIFSGIGVKKIAIIGNGETRKILEEELKRNWYKGYSLVEVIESTEKIDKKIRTMDIDEVFIVSANFDRRTLNSIVIRLEGLVNLKIIPNISQLSLATGTIEALGTVMLLVPPHNLYKKTNVVIKRIFDIILSMLLSIIFSPLFILIPLLIKLDSKGPVLYKQKRLGRGEKPFILFKFRTMYVDSERRLRKYLRQNPAAAREWEVYRKLKNDPRVTGVGKFLRKWSLDELPQLFNVLRGEMSLVGPRPYLPEERGRIGRYRKIIYRVKPGITGMWQIRGRSKLPFEVRLALDEFYVRNWSLWMDISILLQTVVVVISGKGAY